MKLLVVNAGSSSLKYQLFDTADYTVAAKGICERIGQDVGVLDHKNLLKGTRTQKDLAIPTHTDAVRIVIDALTDAEIGVISDMAEIEAVGHRIVHGGYYFSESMLLNDDVLAKLELSDEEKEQAKKDMTDMLQYVSKLNELDTEGVEAMSHTFSVHNVFREDVVTNGDDRDNMLINAPEQKDGAYKVPKILS